MKRERSEKLKISMKEIFREIISRKREKNTLLRMANLPGISNF